MEISLKFKNQAEAEVYLAGPELHGIVYEFENYLRTKLKYEEISSKERDIFEQVKTKWFEIKEGHRPDFPQ